MKITLIAISLMTLLILFPINAKGSELVTNNTFLPWKSQDDKTLQVSIIKETPLSPDQIKSVKKAITGFGTIKFDDTLAYVSWQEALETASEHKTKFLIPRLEIIEDNNRKADITITITDEKNAEGYSGYTSYVLENNKIEQSNITIYDINNIPFYQISSITRHEFGHALGLTHSGSPDDLMYNIVYLSSYVTDCDVSTLLALYDGSVQSVSECGI